LTVTGSLLWDACGMTTGLAPAVRFGPALLVVVFGLGGLSVISYGWLFEVVPGLVELEVAVPRLKPAVR
jgi:hypothetical protein